MSIYYVINAEKTWGCICDSPSSFEARKAAARITKANIGDFFALREDLMTDNDWKVWNRIES